MQEIRTIDVAGTPVEVLVSDDPRNPTPGLPASLPPIVMCSIGPWSCESGAIGPSLLPWPSRLTYISAFKLEKRKMAEEFRRTAADFQALADGIKE